MRSQAPLLSLILAALLAGCAPKPTPCVLLAMDPLAEELACPCVGGYAQRDYRALAAYLTRHTGVPFQAVFAEELGKGLRLAGARPVALVVGKDALVRSDAARVRFDLAPLARLTDRQGRTTLTGLFVVKQDDPAQSLADLRGRRVLFGTADAAEKHAAARAALAAAGVPLPPTIESLAGCTETAAAVAESDAQPPPAGVISSYALPLLEGCGTVPAGALRVVGETAPVPFVTVFASSALPPARAERVLTALLTVRKYPLLLARLESRDGFVPHDAAVAALGGRDWPDWRGPRRDGHVPRLPERLPETARVLWRQPLSGPGLAGLSVADGRVYVADRDPTDTRDVFLAFRARDGELVWQLEYPAAGRLDYGQSPRATPVVRDGRAVLLGAHGQLHCVNAHDGRVVWRKDLPREFGAAVPRWGFCSPPLWVDDRLIVNPGARQAGVVALDAKSGRVRWRADAGPAAYGAFIVAHLGGRRQIVGHDQRGLGGWDLESGRLLWAIHPPHTGDFNVPTPVECDGRLLVVTENNGTRLYAFREDGRILDEPVAQTMALSSETATPVITGGHVFGWDTTLRGLDLADGLKEVWQLEGAAPGDHASLIAADGRVLVATSDGELLLLAVASAPKLVSRLRVAAEGGGGYAHPAVAGGRLFLRDAHALVCLALE